MKSNLKPALRCFLGTFRHFPHLDTSLNPALVRQLIPVRHVPHLLLSRLRNPSVAHPFLPLPDTYVFASPPMKTTRGLQRNATMHRENQTKRAHERQAKYVAKWQGLAATGRGVQVDPILNSG